jgi:hypothetical protein
MQDRDYFPARLRIHGARTIPELEAAAARMEATVRELGLPDTDPDVQDLRRRVVGCRRLGSFARASEGRRPTGDAGRGSVERQRRGAIGSCPSR